MMPVTLTLSEEELDELDALISQRLNPELVEIHRTDRLPYKMQLQHRHRVHEHLLELVRQARNQPITP